VYRSEDSHRKILSRYLHNMYVDVMSTLQYLIARWMQNLRLILRWLRLLLKSYGRTNADKICWSVLCSSWWVGSMQSTYKIWQRGSLDLYSKTLTTPARGECLYYAIRAMWKYLIEQKMLFPMYRIGKIIFYLIRCDLVRFGSFAWALRFYVVIAQMNWISCYDGRLSATLEWKLFKVSKHLALTRTVEE
jgi:hypothetical protein